MPDGSIPIAPFDMVVARMERRPFRDATGALKTPVRPSAAHYHFKLACIRAVQPNFVSAMLQIPSDVSQKFALLHRQHLHMEFGL